ncbi:short chain dehydrogenase family protein [Burkholderia ambifaria AMMD]|uniref:Short-chain dehydrogenase/reductase SDR n=1 Tax=Burkholderia ambifaria (strain ATCC BAA-244 / DSM 16087 / CCUG 44356 / LMG 19182 / AMMD) TaxID=339670 RepID=Q0B254_BURCM|nr:glucose 1-dehydrogenase [Burkholderia ambifaria]ABI91769.1 short-chain dehydrogenase/reductase SDR [Burkholderia ambifaria AMMD]AJY26731.1 short chain dehydrogenase family protein [Burkholderia ambifaria AMMD]MBR7932408.1 glucose 1-dehydrogenase [Burkholderia ambifaria]PEH70366.1 3-oxoacyl-ACP reductase [Burkholderia ambifaria]QQC08460.1 glucose 1-dehydrogenase [Burkholderia ambifaria]
MERLFDKVALVTGATSGIGKATAMLFAREGAKVAIAARREEEGRQVVREILDHGGEAIFVRTDVAQAEDCAAAVARTVASFGKLDIAFNNAGITSFGRPVADTDEQAWSTVIDVNLTGTFLSMKYEIPEILKAGGGSIINMSSAYGLAGSAFGACSYHASKHGVIGLTRAAALEYAKEKLRVNAICPAFVATDMIGAFLEQPEQAAQLAALHPVGRMGTLAETAEAVVFLASDASTFITGTTLSIDGGMGAG